MDCASHTRAIVRAAAEVREDFFGAVRVRRVFHPQPDERRGRRAVRAEQRGPRVVYAGETAFRSGQFEDLCAAHREIGWLSSIYTIGDDFVTTIKAAVAAKFGGLGPFPGDTAACSTIRSLAR